MIGHGQWGAYWIPPHLTKPLAQFHFCSLTCLAASTPFLSSFRSQLLPPSDCNFCSTGMQLDLSSCCFIFLLCYPSKQPSWALSDGINVKSEKNQFLSLSLSDKWQGFWFGWGKLVIVLALLSFSVIRTCIAETLIKLLVGLSFTFPATTTRVWTPFICQVSGVYWSALLLLQDHCPAPHCVIC